MTEEDGITYYLDYSIDDCLFLTQTHLRKFSFENRFYFVTTFLLREQFIKDVALDTLCTITVEQLHAIRKRLEIRYRHHEIYYAYDETGYSLEEYLSSMYSSFTFALSIAKENIEEYWKICETFHENDPKLDQIEKRLIALTSKNIR